MGTLICKKLTAKSVLKKKNQDLQAVHLFSLPADNQNIFKNRERREVNILKSQYLYLIFLENYVYTTPFQDGLTFFKQLQKSLFGRGPRNCLDPKGPWVNKGMQTLAGARSEGPIGP